MFRSFLKHIHVDHFIQFVESYIKTSINQSKCNTADFDVTFTESLTNLVLKDQSREVKENLNQSFLSQM